MVRPELSPEISIDNPVRILLGMLIKASQQSHDRSIKEAFQVAMEIGEDRLTFFEGFTHLIQLIQQIEKHLKYLPLEKYQAYLVLIQDIKQHLVRISLEALAHPDDTWSIAYPINDPNWISLKILPACAFDLEAQRVFLTKDLLNNIEQEIEQLQQSIEAFQLNEYLQFFLVERLKYIQNKIKQYHVYASGELRKEILAIIGEIHISKTQADGENERNFVREVINQLKNLSDSINPVIDSFFDRGETTASVVSQS